MTLLGRILALSLVAMLGAAGVLDGEIPVADAQAAEATCLADAEPNDDPGQATSVAGAFCLDATLEAGDQDLLVWELDSADGASWAISLLGEPGVLTSLRLFTITSEPGVEPPATDALVTALDAGPGFPATETRQLLLAPGRYLAVIAGVDGEPDGAPPTYHLQVQPGPPLPSNLDSEPNDDLASASPVEGAFESSGSLSGSPDLFRWEVPQASGDERWELGLEAASGMGVTLSLLDAEGNTIAYAYTDRDGRARFVDLDLAAGEYGVRLDGAIDGALPYALRATHTVPIADAEPNDLPGKGLQLDPLMLAARGRLYPEGDTDRFEFEVPADEAPILREIRLLPAGPYRRLCLALAGGETMQCREGTEGVVLDALVLAPGRYELAVSGDADETASYVVRVDRAVTPVRGYEIEPNDIATTATPMDPTAPMRGRGRSGDVDDYRLDISGEAQLWQMRATGPGVAWLQWIKRDGGVLARASLSAEDGSLVLDDVYLTPGAHWFAVQADEAYELQALPMGPPLPDGEREPNDMAAFAEPFRLSRGRVVGRLPRLEDTDVFRFSLAAPEHLRLRTEPPADGSVDLRIEAGGVVGGRRSPGLGRTTEYEVRLQPGDYEVWLTTTTPSDGRYTFTIDPLDPLTLPADLEPNDDLASAADLPATLRVAGTGTPGGEEDWYRLPPLADGSVIQVEFDGAVDRVAIEGPSGRIPGELAEDGGRFTSTEVMGGGPSFLVITALGDYRVEVSAPGLTAAEPPPELPLDLALSVHPSEVAAYWPTGQRLEATLALANTSDQVVEVDLDGVTSQAGWIIAPESGSVEVPPTGSLDVPLMIHAQPDAWADEPVRLTMRARAADGGQRTVTAAVTPRRDAPPVAPERSWTVPMALLGGLDVASLALGASPLPVVDPDREAQLHDGLSHVGMGFWADTSLLPLDLTVDLAGDAPVPVAGVILDPQAGDAIPGNAPREVELSLSTDGVEFQPVLQAELSPLMQEQSFVLDAPVPASWARLRLLSTWPGGTGRVSLGEWKVIAAPDAVVGGPIDLAEPGRGGHIVTMSPQPSDPAMPRSMLDEDLAPQTLYLDAGVPISWVVGFADDRAAQVERLEWRDPLPSDPSGRLRRVKVELSLDGPVGPWQALGTWELERAADGSVTPLVLDHPTWVRYLRFTTKSPGKDWGSLELPGDLAVIEVPSGPGYRSILGAWGAAEPAGPYEWSSPSEPAPAPPIVDAGNAASALPLEPGRVARGLIEYGGDEDWYALSVPEGHNSLTIELAGEPILVVSLTLLDAEGFEVPVLFGPGAVPDSVRYSAEVVPGGSYYLRVQQPPASIVFTFDTSGSMGPYLDYVYQGLRAFTADIAEGEEAVKIVPFEEDPLLDDWSDQPYVLQEAVDDYQAGDGSSSAESALIAASTEFSVREGARAILIVTDAETSSYARAEELWRILASSRPMIFAVHVGATVEPALTRAWMEDWSRVNGGVYRYVRSHAEMDRAFDRLATWLRRPAAYTLEATTSFRAEPPPSAEPGSITVRAAKGADGSVAIAADVAVEIILDTSGSMLKRLGRQRRIDVARDVLTELVRSRLPAGSPVALRVFGDRAQPCATNLAVPLGPLEPAQVVRLVNDLRVDQETDTPIAAALSRVPDDLGDGAGTKIVLLITDGEETCGGNPAAAIRDLRRRGIDARLNLVGLALSDPEQKARLRKWARAGQGAYFDANSTKGLAKAVQQAVQPPVRVLDAAGNEVATATVGGGRVSVPPGTYSVLVLTDPVRRFDAVEVRPGKGVVLELTAEAVPTDGEPGEAAAGDYVAGE